VLSTDSTVGIFLLRNSQKSPINTQIIWRHIVFAIRDKILKPGYRVAEKKKSWKPEFFSGFEINVILRDKNSNSF